MNHFRGTHAVLRIVAVVTIATIAIYLAAAILPGVSVEDPEAALAAAILIGLINAIVWPVFIRVALPITVLTLGLGALVLNGLVVLAVSSLDTGFRVDGLGAAVMTALIITVVNAVVTSLLAIDDDSFYYRNVVRRQARRVARPEPTDVPGVFFIEIDGLAHDVVVRALRDGNMPTLASWLRDGSHRLVGWETDWSSQTGACQAGLLHGNNHDYPAFRWWEKERNAAIVTNHPRDAVELERRHSDGRGLLHEDGASRANILSGDAVHSLLTMSTVLDRKRPGRIGQDYFAYFANPYSVTRTLTRTIGEIASERWSAAQQRRMGVEPRVHRGFVYAIMRAWATVIQLDLQVESVIADLYAGRPVCYTTFLAYDEVAHHSGIERPETLAVLRRVDRAIRRITAAAEDAPRPYRFVILSDHGQSQGATFLQRYGTTLEDLVREATGADSVASGAQGSETAGYIGASLTEASEGDGAGARALRAATKNRMVDGEVRIGEADGKPKRRRRARSGDDAPAAPPELSVMASGCLGLVSFPREPGRVSLERLEALHPRLIGALRDHPGIGFLLVRSEARGAVVIGKRGTNYLDEGRVEGKDPLAPFGPNAAHHVRRTDSFPHCADIMLNSTYWSDMEEVAAFEELVGSHGGMGGPQSHPFAAVPVEFADTEDDIVGAEELHRQMRRWLADLGHSAYA